MIYLIPVRMCLVITTNYHIYEAYEFVVIHQPGCILLPIILPGHNEEYLSWNNLSQIKCFTVSVFHHYVLNATIIPKQ
jgi:hypothetical protein